MSLVAWRERLNKRVPLVPVEWRPTRFIYSGTEQNITVNAGIGPMVDLFFEDPLHEDFEKCLPERKSNASFRTEVFAMTTLCSAWVGHDCLDDVWEFHDDPGIREKLGGHIPAPKTLGDWLRDFNEEGREGLDDFLREQSRRYRKRSGDPENRRSAPLLCVGNWRPPLNLTSICTPGTSL